MPEPVSGVYCAQHPAAIFAAGLALLAPTPLDGGLLYITGFENFPVGPDNWVGQLPPDDWQGNSIGTESHGIDEKLVGILGQTAYLGVNEPNATLVTVAKELNHDPVASGTARIQFDSVLGIEDSTNGRRDSFFISFYNSTGDWMAALRFSNELATYGIWREDGVNLPVDTGLAFIIGELHLICIEIDYQNNRWKADIDGIPLFNNAPFTANPAKRDLGSLAVEWQLAGATPAEFGNNWMLFADCAVWAIPVGESQFAIDTLQFDSGGQPTFDFTGEPGWTYQIQYSDNLFQWHNDLPGSLISGIETEQQVNFTDPTAGPEGRYYRVMRTVTP